jgi:eukaryotic-like serine/threonine-protein kinase
MNEETLFDLALNTPPDALPALLARECDGNPALRERIEKLLAAHAASSDTLMSPTSGAELDSNALGNALSRPAISLDAAVGTVLGGKYKLMECIGEGGMGSVYRAQQTEPIKREVAVKVIKAGMDSKAVLARFEAERQALAMMDHPSIAKVLDAGATQSGNPFFVMELVKGVPITKYCDQAKLTPKQRLELFLPVCEAIQHSHQKGIIHRDIKPSNVLVATYDDRPVPKVIDFGVAKATGQSLTDLDAITGLGTLVGTPEYMSPEQASLSNQDIDTRSDVYSLGVLLYELLSGHTPVDRKSLEKAAIYEILRIVRDVDAPLLSAKLSSIDTLPNVAANRRTEPRKLATQFRGELDWVLLKALEKDRSRRYATANGLASDIQRYLSDKVVEARPPSTFYTLRKVIRRNKGQVLAACLLLLTLLAGIAGTTWGMIRAESGRVEAENARAEEAKQREIAQANEAKAIQAKEEETKQRAIATEEKTRAVHFRDKALDALRAMTSEDVEKLIGEKTQLTENERTYLDAIAKRWESFASQDGTDQQSMSISGEGHYQVAFLWDKLGRREETLRACEEALAIREKLSADFPDIADYRQSVADSHNFVGHVLSDLGRHTESLFHYRKGVGILETLTAESPKERTYREGLGLIQNNLGLLYMAQGKFMEATEMFRQGLMIKEQLAIDFPDQPLYREQLATHQNNFAVLLEKQGKTAEALKMSVQGLEVRKSLVADFPSQLEYQQDLASSYATHSRMLRDLELIEESLKQIRESLAIRKKLATDYPAIGQYSKALSGSYNGLGLLLRKLGKNAEAEEAYRNQLATDEKLVADFPTVPEYRQNLAVCHNNLGVLLKSLRRLSDAEAQYRKGIDIREKLALDFTAVPQYRHQLSQAYYNFGNLLLDEKKYKKADEYYRKAFAIQEKLVSESTQVPTYREDLSGSYRKLASVSRENGKPDEALDFCYKGIAILEKLVTEFPNKHDYQVDLGRVYDQLATLKFETDKVEESIAWFDRAIRVLGPIPEAYPEIKAYSGILSRCYEGRARAREKNQSFTEAAADWGKAIELSSRSRIDDLRASRAWSLVHSGAIDEGLALVDELKLNPNKDAELWYQCARVVSFASGKQLERRNEFADRAMNLLGNAVQSGYNKVSQLKSDSDFDSIRDRDDFEKLLSKLEAKQPRADSPPETKD